MNENNKPPPKKEHDEPPEEWMDPKETHQKNQKKKGAAKWFHNRNSGEKLLLTMVATAISGFLIGLLIAYGPFWTPSTRPDPFIPILLCSGIGFVTPFVLWVFSLLAPSYSAKN
jgi:hypothetical protein